MTLAWIRKAYAVPASRGGRVEYTGEGKPELGTILGARGGHLSIRLDGAKHAMPFHPTWELRYLQPLTDRERAALAYLAQVHWIAKACGDGECGSTARARRLLRRLGVRGLVIGEGVQHGALIRWWKLTDAGRAALAASESEPERSGAGSA